MNPFRNQALKFHCLATIVLSASLALASPTLAAVSDSTWDNYFSMAKAASRQSDWNKAQQFWRLCLQEADDTGADPNRVVPSLQGQADALTQLGRVQEAQKLYQRAYDILLKEKGSQNPATVNAMVSLASCYESQGKNRIAEAFYNKVLAVGSTTSDTAVAAHGYHSAAKFWGRRGQFAKSDESFRQAIPKVQQLSGLNSSQMRVLLQDYRDMLRQNGKESEAVKVDSQLATITVANSRIQPDGSTAGSSMDAATESDFDQSLQNVNQSGYSGQQNEANKLVDSAEPVSTNSMFATLSEVSATQKRYEEAEPLYKKVIQIDEQSLGPDHPALATDLSNLALLYVSNQKYSDALPLFTRALSVLKTAYGDNNLAVVECKMNLANVCEKLSQNQQAEQYYKEALAGSSGLGPSGQFLNAKILNKLAFFYYRQSRFSEAESMYIQALASSEKAMGMNSRLVAGCLEDYARVLKAMGKNSEAGALTARARQIFSIAGRGI